MACGHCRTNRARRRIFTILIRTGGHDACSDQRQTILHPPAQAGMHPGRIASARSSSGPPRALCCSMSVPESGAVQATRRPGAGFAWSTDLLPVADSPIGGTDERRLSRRRLYRLGGFAVRGTPGSRLPVSGRLAG